MRDAENGMVDPIWKRYLPIANRVLTVYIRSGNLVRTSLRRHLGTLVREHQGDVSAKSAIHSLDTYQEQSFKIIEEHAKCADDRDHEALQEHEDQMTACVLRLAAILADFEDAGNSLDDVLKALGDKD